MSAPAGQAQAPKAIRPARKRNQGKCIARTRFPASQGAKGFTLVTTPSEHPRGSPDRNVPENKTEPPPGLWECGNRRRRFPSSRGKRSMAGLQGRWQAKDGLSADPLTRPSPGDPRPGAPARDSGRGGLSRVRASGPFEPPRLRAACASRPHGSPRSLGPRPPSASLPRAKTSADGTRALRRKVEEVWRCSPTQVKQTAKRLKAAQRL